MHLPKFLPILTFLTTHHATSLLHEPYKSPESTLQQAIQTITQFWATHDVTLISHDVRGDNRTRLIANTISNVVLKTHPTSSLQLQATRNFTKNDFSTTSRTFFIFVYGTLSPPCNYDMTVILRCLFRASYKKHSPKVLLVLTFNDQVNMQPHLEFLWRHMFPYIVILQTPSPDTLIVHQYNRFTRSYTQKPYTNDVENWYVDKFRTIHGWNLTLCDQFGIRISDDFLKLHLAILQTQMNASVVAIPEPTTKLCDLTYNLNYLLFNSYYESSVDYTVAVYIDRYCLFVPPLVQKLSGVTPWGFIVALSIGFVIVIVISLFSALINIQYFKEPFNVVIVMLGMSSPRRLSVWIERIIYLCLVHVATRYMSMFYTELFTVTAMGQKELVIQNFEDLYDLGLTIAVDSMLHDVFIKDNDIVPMKVRDMFTIVNYSDASTLRSMKKSKVAYFTLEMLETYGRHSENHTARKMTDLCLGSVSLTHNSLPRSPYNQRVNDLLMRINEYGLRQYNDPVVSKMKRRELGVGTVEVDKDSSFQSKMVMILFSGYLISVLVCVGEVVVERVRGKVRVYGGGFWGYWWRKVRGRN